jgi:hypothetical protein
MEQDIRIYIQPRQSGKTSFLINEFCNSPKSERPILLFANNNMVDNAIRNFKIGSISHKNKFQTPANLSNLRHGESKFDTVYIDEYLFMSVDAQREIYEHCVKNPNVKTIVSWTTSNKLYDLDILNSFKNWKSIHPKFFREFDIGVKPMTPEFSALYHSLLTEPSCEVIQVKPAARMSLTDEQYKTEYLGEIWEKRC